MDFRDLHSPRRRCGIGILTLACLLVISSAPLSARQRWISVTTSNFEMYTTSSEAQAIQALQGFEQVRSFFLQSSAHPLAAEGRVRIIAFSSEKEFKPYRASAGAFAYYQQSHERDYIVMEDIEREHHQAAVHEYTHLIVQHMKLELPLWLNEGMADLYSSLEPRGKKAMVGRPLPGHSMVLASRPWMDWNVLFAVDHDSGYYNVPDKMELFYAQSWALTHMLELGANYSSGFPRFLATVAGGSTSAEALRTVYGKSVDEVGSDVQRYVRQATVRAAVYDVTLSKLDLDPQVADLSQFDSELALADLLSTRIDTAGEARRRLLALEQQNPNSVELEVSMGYLDWQQNHLDDARKHFLVAIDHGLKDPTLLYHYAQLLQGTDASAKTVESLLSQVIALQPDNIDARIALAGTALSAGHHAVALAALGPIKKVTPDRAYRFFAISAMVRCNLKDYVGAKNNAAQALTYAKAPGERTQMEDLMVFVDRASMPPQAALASSPNSVQHAAEPEPTLVLAPAPTEGAPLPQVQGKTKSFECVHGGTYRLHLQVGTQEMVFAMPEDPRDVIVKNMKNGMTNFNCGPMPPRNITVVYKPAEDNKSTGVIAELVF